MEDTVLLIYRRSGAVPRWNGTSILNALHIYVFNQAKMIESND